MSHIHWAAEEPTHPGGHPGAGAGRHAGTEHPSLCLSLLSCQRGQKGHSVEDMEGLHRWSSEFPSQTQVRCRQVRALPGLLSGSVTRPWPHGGPLGRAHTEPGSWALCPSDVLQRPQEPGAGVGTGSLGMASWRWGAPIPTPAWLRRKPQFAHRAPWV